MVRFFGLRIGAILLLSGCQHQSYQQPYLEIAPAQAQSILADKTNAVLKKGHDQAYSTGYRDGCSTAYRLVGFKSFAAQKRRSASDLYHQGWQIGYQACQQAAHEKRDQERQHYLQDVERDAKNEDILIWESLRK